MTYQKTLERIAFLLLCLAALAACKKKEGGNCDFNSDCVKGLYCVSTDPPSAHKTCMTEAQGVASCRGRKDCVEKGMCGHNRVSGACLPESAADCLQSTMCKTQNHCELVNGFCTAKPAATTSGEGFSGATSPGTTGSGSCPSGYTRRSDGECVKYTCPSGCTYIGDGKCRCRK